MGSCETPSPKPRERYIQWSEHDMHYDMERIHEHTAKASSYAKFIHKVGTEKSCRSSLLSSSPAKLVLTDDNGYSCRFE